MRNLHVNNLVIYNMGFLLALLYSLEVLINAQKYFHQRWDKVIRLKILRNDR